MRCKLKVYPLGGARTIGGRGGAVGVFDGAGGVDLVYRAAQLQQLPPRPALYAVPPASPLRTATTKYFKILCLPS